MLVRRLLTGAPADPRQRLLDRCTARNPNGTFNRAGDRFLMRISRRRKWSLHRHVHLVAAFHAANDLRPVKRMLAVGAGSGLSELYLAAMNPRLHLTLTDIDVAPLEANRRVAEELGVTNVSYEALDLLRPREVERFDFVSAMRVEGGVDDAQGIEGVLDLRSSVRPR